MTALLMLGVVTIFMGLLLLVAPGLLSRVSKFLNRTVYDESAVLGHRILVALISIAVGALLLWMYFGHHVPYLMN